MSNIRDNLNQHVFERKIKKLRAKHKRKKKFMNYDRIRSVFLLYESKHDEKNLLIEAIKKGLIHDKKKVTMCGFVNKKESATPVYPDSYMINLSQVNFFKEPKKQFTDKLLEKKYDVVLDLTLKEVLPLQYILAYVDSPFKVGRKTESFELLDFMIDMTHVSGDQDEESLFRIDEDYLFRQIIFYLKNIKSNN